ncbi:MAG: hypothetical protein IPF94_14110 [Betaproteobacteria bacterium]|nr:hypothetical protein [Betaproteobacteria bacterium]
MGLTGLLAALAILAGCAQRPAPTPAPPVPPPAAAAASAPPAVAPPSWPSAPPPAAAPTRAAEVPSGPIPRNPRYVTLPPPPAPRSEAELRAQLALRLVAAHPDSSYTARPPQRLLAIPVLEVELNADGSVRDIKVLRKPSTGNEATALAVAAVRRAAPYGNLSNLPRPWKVVETFLFDDHLRFKPRTLDVD